MVAHFGADFHCRGDSTSVAGMSDVPRGRDRHALLRLSADAYARVALANVLREFPHHEPLLQTGPEPVAMPRDRHPAFYGSYDWHSCVEMHWVLVRLLRAAPDSVPEAEIRAVLDAHLTADAAATEASWFADPNRRTAERPYGWGWALALATELGTWMDADAARWERNLTPLTAVLVERFLDWLPGVTYPVRHGVHDNTAFGLSLALPYARLAAGRGDRRLLDAIRGAADRWYAGDVDFPAGWEPSGADFLSPALTEAELMVSLLEPEAFTAWLGRFLPGLAVGEPAAIFTPAVVSDPSDGQIAHLHGLNLSRAWCLERLAAALPGEDDRPPRLRAAADEHARASLGQATGSDYAVEHWLVAYAVLLLSLGAPV
jgi:hypothetical protein